jgi:hypothetical protein
VDRNLLFLTLALFFGTGIVFRAIGSTTRDQGIAVALGLQAAVALAVVGAIVLIARRRRGPRD